MMAVRAAKEASCQPPNKQLQRTVTRRRGDGASAPLHYALAPRVTRQRAAAELRRYTARMAYRAVKSMPLRPNGPLLSTRFDEL
jgi:hypothetical protein